MYTHRNLVTHGWDDYELLDSGDGNKLERFGEVILIRPETQAIWKKNNPKLWINAHAVFLWNGGKGSWQIKKKIPEKWNLSWKKIQFFVRLTSFKHIGIFPEQVTQWEWIESNVNCMPSPKVLNLFGYTGGVSVVAANAGAYVTHVDASKQSISWAKENALLSSVSESMIRYIFDDALKFVKREVRRKSQYEGIILDPPAFGRGAKGEVWKIEDQLSELMELLKDLLSEKKNSFFLLNGYAAGYSAQSFLQLCEGIFGMQNGEFGELHIEEKSKTRRVSSGIFVRFTR